MLKDLHGTATQTAPAPIGECLALLRAVDRYPEWYPDTVREVVVLERDAGGQPCRARTKLHLAWGPVVKDFDLVLAVDVDAPSTVTLSRIRERPSSNTFDVIWRLREKAATQIDLELKATLDVPRFLPLVGIGDAIAGGFVGAAARELAG